MESLVRVPVGKDRHRQQLPEPGCFQFFFTFLPNGIEAVHFRLCDLFAQDGDVLVLEFGTFRFRHYRFNGVLGHLLQLVLEVIIQFNLDGLAVAFFAASLVIFCRRFQCVNFSVQRLQCRNVFISCIITSVFDRLPQFVRFGLQHFEVFHFQSFQILLFKCFFKGFSNGILDDGHGFRPKLGFLFL